MSFLPSKGSGISKIGKINQGESFPNINKISQQVPHLLKQSCRQASINFGVRSARNPNYF